MNESAESGKNDTASLFQQYRPSTRDALERRYSYIPSHEIEKATGINRKTITERRVAGLQKLREILQEQGVLTDQKQSSSTA